MRALRRFTVRLALPAPLAPLAELVMNLRWSWHPASLDLFRVGRPRDVGGRRPGPGAPARRGRAPSGWPRWPTDAEFLAPAASGARRPAGLPHDAALVPVARRTRRASIAYFSPEFGITEVLPQYSGGLGILAGDHLKAASDLGVPILGVGLLYRAGYFKQSLNAEGWQQERYPPLDPHGLPLTLLTGADGAPLHGRRSTLPGRTLHAQVWQAQVGRVPLLLLDSDVELNAPAEREVTDRLYGGGTDHRLHQELLLGIGGVRAIRAYTALTGDPEPEVFHTNEGHAGFLGVERVRELVEQGLTFDEAKEAVRAGTVFTTHTPVPAGIDRFPRDLIATLLRRRRRAAGRAGRRGSSSSAPRTTRRSSTWPHMGLRMAQRRNGVAKLHGIVSRGMFAGLWPGFDTAEVPISSVTNGVHAPTWVSREVFELAEREIGTSHHAPRRRAGSRSTKVSDDARLADPPGAARAARRRGPPPAARVVAAARRDRRPSSAGSTRVFDPDVLTIGFARRVPSYKRLTLMLRDPERLRDAAARPRARRSSSSSPARRTRPTTAARSWCRRSCGSPTRTDVRHRIVVPARLRHRHGALPLRRLRRLAQQPAAPARGVRHVAA